MKVSFSHLVKCYMHLSLTTCISKIKIEGKKDSLNSINNILCTREIMINRTKNLETEGLKLLQEGRL